MPDLSRIPLNRRLGAALTSFIIKLALVLLLFAHPAFRVKADWIFFVFGLILGLPMGYFKISQITDYLRNKNLWGINRYTLMLWFYRGFLGLVLFSGLFIFTLPIFAQGIAPLSLIEIFLLVVLGISLGDDILMLSWHLMGV